MQSTKGDKEEASHEQMMDREKYVNRNPHGNFKEVEASRKPWDSERGWQFTQTQKPDWKLGDGATDNGESLKKKHIEIDPYAEGRPAVNNYKLLISSIIPRPIGFVSTRSKDGMLKDIARLSRSLTPLQDPARTSHPSPTLKS